MTWTSFNKPVPIASSLTSETSSFTYCPNRARWSHLKDDGQGGVSQILYVGALYELHRDISGSGDDEQVH